MRRKQVLIVAPSLSPACSPKAVYKRAAKNLETWGYQVTWAPNAKRALDESIKDQFGSTPVEDKLADFEWALRQPGKLILAALGGYDCYRLLDRIPFQELASAGKVLVGHSDPTLLLNAYYALAGGASWYGQNLRNLGEAETGELSAENFDRVLSKASLQSGKFPVYKDNPQEPLRKVRGWKVIRPGQAQGVGIGGNSGTFYLLQGTKFMPKFDKPVILFLEEDEMPGQFTMQEFDRRLRSILDQPGAAQSIKGLLIGRFLDSAGVTMTQLKACLAEMIRLRNIPVIANIEIGHGMPRTMLPIGGTITIDTTTKQIRQL